MTFLKTFFWSSAFLKVFLLFSRENEIGNHIHMQLTWNCGFKFTDTDIFIWSMWKPFWRQLIVFLYLEWTEVTGYILYPWIVVNSILYSHITGSGKCVRQEDIYNIYRVLITHAKQFIRWMCSLSELSLLRHLSDRVRPLR